MNDIFNFSRFVKYAKSQLLLQRKLLLLTSSGGFLALFIFTLLFLGSSFNWREQNWTALFMTSGFIIAALITGNAFPFLRNQKACQNALMIPASTLEKFVYEFALKIVVFSILYPLLFQLMASIAVPLIEFIRPDRTYIPFSFDPIIKPGEEFYFTALLMGYIFTISLAFAGASTFRRSPLIKTVLFVSIIILLIIGYLYFIVEELHLNNGVEYALTNTFSEKSEAFSWFFFFLGISSLSSFTYAFFKLKEREA